MTTEYKSLEKEISEFTERIYENRFGKEKDKMSSQEEIDKMGKMFYLFNKNQKDLNFEEFQRIKGLLNVQEKVYRYGIERCWADDL